VAELIVRSYADALASGVSPNISWYDFRNDGTDPYNFEHTMGIVTRDFRPKPAYRAYATMTRLLNGLSPEKPLDLGEGVVAYRFAAAGRPAVTCLWSLDGDRAVPVPAGKPLMRTDLMGGTERLVPEGGRVGVALRAEVPVFLEEKP